MDMVAMLHWLLSWITGHIFESSYPKDDSDQLWFKLWLKM